MLHKLDSNDDYSIESIIERIKSDLFTINKQKYPYQNFDDFIKEVTTLAKINGAGITQLYETIEPGDETIAISNCFHHMDLLSAHESSFKGEAINALMETIYLYLYTKVVYGLLNVNSSSNHRFLEYLYNKNEDFFKARFAKSGNQRGRINASQRAAKAAIQCHKLITQSTEIPFKLDEEKLGIIRNELIKEYGLDSNKKHYGFSEKTILKMLCQSSNPQIFLPAKAYQASLTQKR